MIQIVAQQATMTGAIYQSYSDTGELLRCWRCGRVIGKGFEFHGLVEVKCSRCKAINRFQSPGRCPPEHQGQALLPNIEELLATLDQRWDAQIKAGFKKKAETAPGKRFQVFMRDKFTCVYCGRSPEKDGIALHVDHRVARNNGGQDVLDNLVTACVDCNLGKSDKAL